MTQCGHLQVTGWRQVELLEDRTLLSNLAISDAFLVDGNKTRITSPVLGEQLEVRTSFLTTALPSSAAYAIRVIVDGIAIDRAGVDFGYHLLGSRTLKQGSLSTGLDYSVVEALAQLHWSPGGGGSWVTLSGGPGLFMARATLGSSSVGASFSSEAVEQTRPGLALGVTASPSSAAPVRMGLHAGLRLIPLESGTWTIATARVAILY